VGTVVELWRYPVKSLLGESLDDVEVELRGVRGDRLYAVTDRQGKLGSGKSSRRFRRLPGLFELRARLEDGKTIVTLPDGLELTTDDARLAEFLEIRYGDTLRVLEESNVSHHDAAPLHVLTTASLCWLQSKLPESAIDRRRFRPNILLDVPGSDRVEEEWIGRRFTLGTAVIRIFHRAERCVMTTNPQDELPKDPAVLRAVTKLNDACLGVFATVEVPGTISRGDTLTAAA
jgi:MOSC domain-containing protein